MTQQSGKPKHPGAHHEGMRDAHAGLHANHYALAELHEKEGAKGLAKLHSSIAGHHLELAEHHHSMSEALGGGAGEAGEASEGPEATKPTPAAKNAPAAKSGPAGGDALAKGAATQLLKKGHIDQKTHDRIHKKASKGRPFGSLSGAGHYMGDVDADNSGGTNSAA